MSPNRFIVLCGAAALVLTVAVHANDLRQPGQGPDQPTGSPIVTVPGSPPTVNPNQPNQSAVSVKEVVSPAVPGHFLDGALYALMVSLIINYLKKKRWFPWLDDVNSTARFKAQFSFIAALLTASGIHFAVTGNILDGGAAFTLSGVSVDALKDVAWQWTAQQAWYLGLVKNA